MNYIIKIGYNEYFLQGDKGVTTLINTMSRMQEMEDVKYAYGRGKTLESATLRPVEVSFTPTSAKISKRKTTKSEELIEPEVIPPERKTLPHGAEHISGQQSLRLLGG